MGQNLHSGQQIIWEWSPHSLFKVNALGLKLHNGSAQNRHTLAKATLQNVIFLYTTRLKYVDTYRYALRLL